MVGRWDRNKITINRGSFTTADVGASGVGTTFTIDFGSGINEETLNGYLAAYPLSDTIPPQAEVTDTGLTITYFDTDGQEAVSLNWTPEGLEIYDFFTDLIDNFNTIITDPALAWPDIVDALKTAMDPRLELLTDEEISSLLFDYMASRHFACGHPTCEEKRAVRPTVENETNHGVGSMNEIRSL